MFVGPVSPWAIISSFEYLNVWTGHSKYLVTPAPCLLMGLNTPWAALEKIYFDSGWR